MALTGEQRDKLRAIRMAIRAAGTVTARAGSADEVIRALVCFEQWEPGNYLDKAGAVRVFNGYPYRLGQPHDSTANPDWTPESQPALWWPYHGTTPETALPYRQPTGAHDMYKAGEMMIWVGGAVMRCKSDTAYSPADYAQAWEVAGSVTGPEQPPEDDPGGTEPPTAPVYAAWVQPTGGHDAYALGARVAHVGKAWESTADGNVWEPGVFGWVEVTTDG